MRRWLFLMAGPLIWAVHFAGAYAIASVFELVARADAPASRWLVVLLTLACVAAVGAVLVACVRRKPADETDRFVVWLAAAGSLVTIPALIWQGAAAFV